MAGAPGHRLGIGQRTTLDVGAVIGTRMLTGVVAASAGARTLPALVAAAIGASVALVEARESPARAVGGRI